MSKILITGANSMVGKSIIRNSHLFNHELIPDDKKEFNLLDRYQTELLFERHRPDYVIHLASVNGNISYNNKYPSDIFLSTTKIAENVITTSYKFGVKKVISAISSCAYPDGKSLLVEEEFFDGPPHTSVESHGFAKRYIIELNRQLFKQFGFVSVGMCFNTCYGPEDSFDLNKTKVLGSLIKKFSDAKNENASEVILWGTGNVSREFIYVDDVAYMFKLVIDKYSNPLYPINVGSGKEISISTLSKLVSGIVGYKNKITFDSSKPDGQKSKLLSNENMQKYFGQQNFVSLEDGIKRTVDWYESKYHSSFY